VDRSWPAVRATRYCVLASGACYKILRAFIRYIFVTSELPFLTGILLRRGTQFPDLRSPGRQKFLGRRLIFVGDRYGTSVVLPFWRLEVLTWLLDFWKIDASQVLLIFCSYIHI